MFIGHPANENFQKQSYSVDMFLSYLHAIAGYIC